MLCQSHWLSGKFIIQRVQELYVVLDDSISATLVKWLPLDKRLFVRGACIIAKKIISFVISVRPRGTARLPLVSFSWNLMFGYSRKLKFH